MLRVGAAYIFAAWLVIQVVETIFPAFGFDEYAVRITTIIFAVGLVPVMVLVWVFELTPEGLKLDKDIHPDPSITAGSGRRLDRIIMMMLALSLGYFAFDKFILSPDRIAREIESVAEDAHLAGRVEALINAYGDRSIAVLPFVDMSPEKDQEYMSDGIAEEILNLLVKIPQLRVTSRSSSFAFKNQNVDIRTIAKKLSVAHVLEGSVRKAGNRIRITAQLIDARTDTHLWSKTYDRELDDIFEIQDEIAAAAISEFKFELLGELPTVRQTDPQAYELYLRAQNLNVNVSTLEANSQALDLLRRALAIDPRYVPAWGLLSATYANLARGGNLSSEEAIALARESVEHALAIDPDDAPSIGLNARYYAVYDGDLPSAARQMERALQLEPTNPKVLNSAEGLLHHIGRYEEAIRVQEYLAARAPMSALDQFNLAIIYLAAGRAEDVLNVYRTQSHLLDLQDPYQQFILASALYETGDAKLALETAAGIDDRLMRLTVTAAAHWSLGGQAESDSRLAELEGLFDEAHPNGAVAVLTAWVHTVRGDTDTAFEWLDRMLGDPVMALWPDDRRFKAIHGDPRWAALMERTGKSPEQLNAIKLEIKLPEPVTPAQPPTI